VTESLARHGHRVRLTADKGQPAPPGVWRCLDRSAQGTGHWWIAPADEEAARWLLVPHCPLQTISGHVSYPSRLFTAPDTPSLF
jgi:hypothetical protein